jgi:hypothetical protein
VNVLFIHQNFPGQFGWLAARLAAVGHRVVGLGERDRMPKRKAIPGATRMGYPTPRGGGERTPPCLHRFEGDVRRARDVVRVAFKLASDGFIPDIIYGNPGWGELLFVKDVFPSAAVIALDEFYFRPRAGAALATRDDYQLVREVARARVVERYDFERVCGPAQVALIERAAA